MSYDLFEQSIHDGAPIEVFKFIGSFQSYYYTSYHEQLQVNGEWYQPIYIKRGTVKAGTHEDTNLILEVRLPFNTDLALDYAYSVAPPSLRLELRRAHRGSNLAIDWRMLWTGTVRGHAVVGRECILKIPSVFSDVLEGEVPSVYFQQPCNHTLYDPRCGVSRAAHTTVTTVVAVGSLAIEVVDDGVGTDVLAAGEMVNTRTGERRLIMSNLADIIEIGFPFVDIVIGDTVQLSKGCDLAYATCVNKFANGLRFGGDPFMPGDNPFEGSLG